MFGSTKARITDKLTEPAQKVATVAVAALFIAAVALLVAVTALGKVS